MTDLNAIAFVANVATVPVNITFGDLPDISKAFVVEYGLKQYIQDGAAASKEFTSGERKGEKKTAEELAAEKKEGVEDRIANLQSGEFTRRGTAERLSPEEAERNRIVEAALRESAKAANIKLPTKKADPDWWADRAARYYAKYQSEVDAEVARRIKDAAKKGAKDMTGILD